MARRILLKAGDVGMEVKLALGRMPGVRDTHYGRDNATCTNNFVERLADEVKARQRRIVKLVAN